MNRIDYSKLRSLSAKEIISALIRDGFYLERQAGSHDGFINMKKYKEELSLYTLANKVEGTRLSY